LSLSAVYPLLWQLLAVYNSKYRHCTEAEGSKTSSNGEKMPARITERLYKIGMHPVLAIVILGLIIYFPITYRTALSHATAYDRYAKVNNVDLAVAQIRKAVQLDPLNNQYNIKYLSYLLAKKDVTTDEMEKVVLLTEKVEKLVPLMQTWLRHMLRTF